jgi:hypothetical protein
MIVPSIGRSPSYAWANGSLAIDSRHIPAFDLTDVYWSVCQRTRLFASVESPLRWKRLFKAVLKEKPARQLARSSLMFRAKRSRTPVFYDSTKSQAPRSVIDRSRRLILPSIAASKSGALERGLQAQALFQPLPRDMAMRDAPITSERVDALFRPPTDGHATPASSTPRSLRSAHACTPRVGRKASA